MEIKEYQPIKINLSLKDISKKYSNLDIKYPNISLINGDYLQIRGASGSGKTTLCEILVKFLSFDSGTITLNNQEISSINVFNYIHYISQFPEHNLIGPTALDELNLWGVEINNPEIILQEFNVPDLPIWKLSFGQKKALSFAVLKLCPRTIWILDEPFAGLDANMKEKLCELINDFRQTGGVVIEAVAIL